MSNRLSAPAIRGKGARARLKEHKRWEAIERQEAAIARATDRRTGRPYAFADVDEFEKRSDLQKRLRAEQLAAVSDAG